MSVLNSRLIATLMTFAFFGLLAGGSTGGDDAANKKLDPKDMSGDEVAEVLAKKVATIGATLAADELSGFGGKSIESKTREEAEAWEKLLSEKDSFVGIKAIEWECQYWGEKGVLGSTPSCSSRHYVFSSLDKYGSAGKVWFDLKVSDSQASNLKVFPQDNLIVSGVVDGIKYAKVVYGNPPSISTNRIIIRDATVKIKPKK